MDERPILTEPTPAEPYRRKAATILINPEDTADVHFIAAVLGEQDADRSVAVVSDDRRVRNVTRGLGGTVTGTIGVVVRNVDAGLDPDAAKQLVRRLDGNGLHMTAELRDRVFVLFDEAAGVRTR